MSAVPEDPYVLEITSVTFGSADFTAFARSQYDLYSSQNPNSRSWSFTSSIDYFKPDPNPNVPKICCVVWRNTITTPDGEVVWSDFKRAAAVEDALVNIKFDGQGDTPWNAPALPSTGTGRCIIAAYWFNKDCLSVAQNICSSQFRNTQHGLQFDVSPATLGADPQTSNDSKQFSVTYGSYVGGGDWTFSVQCAVGPSAGWTLTLPILFPPCVTPNVYDHNTYVTFRNESSGVTLYPQIYALDMSLAWDGRVPEFAIPNGTSKDVDLIARASLQERGCYYCGFSTLDGQTKYGSSNSYVIASSSSMARPCALYCRSVNNIILSNYDFVNFSNPMSYQPADLRLNIYSVTYGSAVYTDYVRQTYISNTISNPPTNTSNGWSFTANSSPVMPNFFGPDPNNGIGKACVVIYRVAYCIGKTNGVITGPNDPQPWDPLYTSRKIQPLHTDQYPVLQDITGFRIAAVKETVLLSFNLLTESLTPWTAPSPIPNPFIAAAAWSDKDVTSYVAQSVQAQSANGSRNSTISVGTADMGKGLNPHDPWSGNEKQVTVLVGFPSKPGDATTIQWRTIVNMGTTDPWTFVIPPKLASLPVVPQLPAAYVSDVATEPQFTEVYFQNKTNFNLWPQVVSSAGQVFWNGKTVDSKKWTIAPKSNRALLLMTDAHCTEGAYYGLTFTTDNQMTYPPFSGWIMASAKDWWKMYLTYMPDAASGGYDILREVVYGGPR